MPSKLYRHQKQSIRKMLRLNGRALCAMDMGTGKTRVTIETMPRLGNARRILVVLPLSAAGVWRREVRKWAPAARSVTNTLGKIKLRALRVKRLRERDSQRRVYLLVGYESFWREPLRSQILKWAPDAIIYDEGHRLRSHRTRQSKFAHSLAAEGNKIHTPRYVLALTGTPLPNGLHDAFSLFKAIDPTIFGSRWGDFKDRYLVMGGYRNYQITGYKNEEAFKDLLAAHSHRVTKAEALDLPEETPVIWPVTMSLRGRKYYDKMAKEAIVKIEGVQGKGTAYGRIVLSQEVRCQQATSGFMRVEESGKEIDFDTSKQDAYKDLLSDILLQTSKVVVFCRFTHDVEVALKVAKQLGSPTIRFDGKVSRKKRDRVEGKFRRMKRCVLVAQIQTAISIDWSSAHVGIFYSRNWSFLDYDQARSRLHRHGQKYPVTYYLLTTEKSTDIKIAKALVDKEDLQATLLQDKKRAKEFFS